MSAKPMTRLLWNGRESVHEARDLLKRETPVELVLPADFHHAIYSRLHAHPREAHAEQLDVSGGTELLERIAGIRQLSEVSELIDTVEETGSVVQIQSPAPRIILKWPLPN